jgi:hypothetical protein
MTEEQVKYVIRNWTTSQDTWIGDRSWGGEEPSENYVYPPQKEFITKPKWRDLPPGYADEAKAYIAMYCTRYPLQLRAVLGFPMWLRFCDVWSDSGKFRLAMRAI